MMHHIPLFKRGVPRTKKMFGKITSFIKLISSKDELKKKIPKLFFNNVMLAPKIIKSIIGKFFTLDLS
jgi:hypothetical protein